MISKVLRCARTLQASELRNFVKYLDSPYFPIPPKARTFALRWIKIHEKRNWEALTPEQGWKLIFPTDTFNKGDWQKYQSHTLRALKDFWVLERWQGDRGERSDSIALLQEFDERELDHDFELELREIERKARGEIGENFSAETDIWEGVQLVAAQYNFLRARQDPNKSGQEEIELLEQLENLVETAFLFHKLRTATAVENRRYMRREPLLIWLPENFGEFVQNASKGKEPLFYLYSQLFQVFEQPDVAHITAFLKDFWELSPRLSWQERQKLFVYPLNIFMRAYLSDPGLDRAAQLYALYRRALETGILENRRRDFPASHFKNICVVACYLGKIEEASDFVANHANRLVKSEANVNLLGYCQSLLLFHRQEYEACRSLLYKLNRERYLKLEIRTLEMKTVYELADWDSLEANMVSYERFLDRAQHLPANRKQVLRARIDMVKQVRRISNRVMDPTERNRQKEELEEEIRRQNFHDGAWLLGILAAIK